MELFLCVFAVDGWMATFKPIVGIE